LLQGKRDVFALRVKGDSMIDALVNDGDIVVLERADSARDGDMVAAWIKSEETTTLKKFYKEGQRVRLQPANSTMSPIYVDARDVEVQGKLVCRLGTE
jgi:repressor LexA